eukprot:11017-Heterococcus_DN1.PRE.4
MDTQLYIRVLTVLFYIVLYSACTTNSVLPFQAIIEGRQQLPEQYWKEFARGPYAIILAGTVGAYFAHPFMQAGSYLLHCNIAYAYKATRQQHNKSITLTPVLHCIS